MLGNDGRQAISRPPKRQILTVKLQNCKKSAVKHSIEKPVILNFLNLSTIIYPRLYEKIYFHLNSTHTPWNLHFFYILVFQKTHSVLELIFRANELP